MERKRVLRLMQVLGLACLKSLGKASRLETLGRQTENRISTPSEDLSLFS